MGPAYTYRAELLHIVDADTLALRVDVGFRMWAEIPVRLVGLNAPEHNTLAGQDATAFVRDWFTRHGATMMLATQKSPEKYGRWLGTVTSDDGASLNDDLVASKHAFVWDGQGPRPTG